MMELVKKDKKKLLRGVNIKASAVETLELFPSSTNSIKGLKA